MINLIADPAVINGNRGEPQIGSARGDTHRSARKKADEQKKKQPSDA